MVTNKKSEISVTTCKLSRCYAGGPAEDEGHVFDIDVSDERTTNSACRCGTDMMTYHCFFKYASWR